MLLLFVEQQKKQIAELHEIIEQKENHERQYAGELFEKVNQLDSQRCIMSNQYQTIQYFESRVEDLNQTIRSLRVALYDDARDNKGARQNG